MNYSSILAATLSAGILLNPASGAIGASFNGLEPNLGNLYRTSDALTRSISPENFTGEKGKGGMATEGTRQARLERSGPWLESLTLRWHQGGDNFHPR